MSPVVALTSLPSSDAWRARLDASRGTTACLDKADAAELRRRFRQITVQTRAIFLQPLECPALERLADRSLQLSRLAFEELNRLELEPQSAAPMAVVSELLDHDGWLLDAIALQRRLIAELSAAAEVLESSIDELLQGREGSVQRWLKWAEEFGNGLRERSVSEELLPLAGVRWNRLLSHSDGQRSRWLVQAIGTARLAAALSETLIDGDSECSRWLTAAALVQDIGLWAMEGQFICGDRSRALIERQHAAVGAAILVGIRGCPTEIALLVGTHHERIDGSGGPRRLSARALSRRAQILGLLARFCEIAQTEECHAEAEFQAVSLALSAGLTLWRDVRRGAFDEQLTHSFLNALEPGLTDRIQAAHEQRSQLFVDRQHQIPEPHAAVETSTAPAVPQPMYLRRQRSGERRGGLRPAATRQTGNF